MEFNNHNDDEDELQDEDEILVLPTHRFNPF
jgi:hypothetical protein